MFPLDPSDVMLLIDFVLSIVLVLVFSLGRPRTWVNDPLGWVIFYYGLATVALLGLIVWGIAFGQKIDEIPRFIVSFALGAALIWKTHQIILERARGRIAGERSTPTGRKTMSTKNLSVAEIKDATTIWYKGQRVLRSIVGALVVILPVANASALALASYLAEQEDIVIPPVVFLWLNGIVAITALLIGGASRLMAVPGFNAWLTKWLNLGSVPQSAIAVDPVVMEPDESGVFVVPDLKDKTRIGATPSPIDGDARG